MAGSIITLTDASTMTGSFRRNYPNVTKGVYYTSNVFSDIMSQKGCVGIRIYNGVDANGNDLYNGKIYDSGLPCPTVCPVNNPLNS